MHVTGDATYLIRLLPPRPDFPQTMTADELAIMQRHVAYWTGLLERGTAIVFGPVADPRGAWGAGVVRVAHADELRDLEAGDPAIREGSGFRYEVLAMPGAVTAPNGVAEG